jgi:hypothetical protein
MSTDPEKQSLLDTLSSYARWSLHQHLPFDEDAADLWGRLRALYPHNPSTSRSPPPRSSTG